MSSLAEASCLVKQIAEPRPVGDSVKMAIERAYQRIVLRASQNQSITILKDWTRNRTKDIWRGREASVVSADELKELRIIARISEDAARDPELEMLRARLAYAEERLARIDPEFHAPAREALGQQTYLNRTPAYGQININPNKAEE